MLHHRTLAPVIIRDWSIRMESFASADTKFDAKARLNVKDHTTLASTEFIRPEPAASPYLDTATEPVPWPQRSQPQPPRKRTPPAPPREADAALPSRLPTIPKPSPNNTRNHRD
jgi:hypothetical protein